VAEKNSVNALIYVVFDLFGYSLLKFLRRLFYFYTYSFLKLFTGLDKAALIAW
jgi:hypothetical protein